MENDFCFHFHFKWFPALENRRERERESKKIALSEQEYNQIASEQDDRTTPIVQTHPCRTQSPIIEIISPFPDNAQRERQRKKGEWVERSSHHRRDRLAIVLEPTRTRLPTNPLAPHRSHRADEPTILTNPFIKPTTPMNGFSFTQTVPLMIFFLLGFVWKLRKCEHQVENVFSLLFSRIQSNTRKYFPKHFLKCNQILENIFLSRKYFPFRKIFYIQPNTA